MKRRFVLTLCTGSLFALLIGAGCDNSKSSQSQKPAASPASNNNTVAPSATQKPAQAQTAAVPTPATPPPAKVEEVKPVVLTPPSIPPQPAAAVASDDERREQAANLIYAQIRVKMEEAIDERSKLLKAGTDPADPKVRELEGRIMRARDLLTQNGEVVEEVDPPIVQKAPTP